MPAQPYALTDRQAAVLEVLNMSLEWTATELTNEGVEVFCDPCDGTGEGLLNTRNVCPKCHGNGWRWLCHIEVQQTLERLLVVGLVGRGRERDECGNELCGSVYFTPLPDPDDPLEKLWALEAQEQDATLAQVVSLHPGMDAWVHPRVALSRHPWRKAQVARELGVSVRTVSRYMKQGLPYCKPYGARGALRFEPRAVRAWAAARGLTLRQPSST